MIDSHCHLDYEPLFNDIKNVIKRSQDVGEKNFNNLYNYSKL